MWHADRGCDGRDLTQRGIAHPGRDDPGSLRYSTLAARNAPGGVHGVVQCGKSGRMETKYSWDRGDGVWITGDRPPMDAIAGVLGIVVIAVVVTALIGVLTVLRAFGLVDSGGLQELKLDSEYIQYKTDRATVLTYESTFNVNLDAGQEGYLLNTVRTTCEMHRVTAARPDHSTVLEYQAIQKVWDSGWADAKGFSLRHCDVPTGPERSDRA